MNTRPMYLAIRIFILALHGRCKLSDKDSKEIKWKQNIYIYLNIYIYIYENIYIL